SFKMSFTLFPYYCCDHLHLYSFPTRRSSDLSGSTNDLSTLDGGPGNDMLFGSLVNSTYVFRSGNGQDEIHDYDPTFYMFMGKVQDRKSTRLNSSHVKISYAVFCLKKKKALSS